MRVSKPTRVLDTVRTAANAEIHRVGASCHTLRRALRSRIAAVRPRRPKGKAVVEIGARVIKVARIEVGRGNIKVLDLITKRVPGKRADIPKLLKSACDEVGLDAGDVVAVFPRSKAIVRHISLPSADHDEIRRMIALQANRIVPFEQGRAVMDFQIIKTGPDGYSEVMIVMVDCAAVAEYANWLRAAGLGVKTLRLDAECSRDFYLSVTEGRGGSEAENVSLLDLDLTTTNVNIIRGNRLVFTRSLPFGTETLFPDREENLRTIGMFIDQIIDTFASYQKADKAQTISKIVLTGASLNADSVAGELARRLSLPVETPSGVPEDLPAGIASRTPEIALDEVSMSTVAGAAVRPWGVSIDLSPEDLKAARAQRYRMRQRLQIALLGVSILALTSAIVSHRFNRMETYLAELTRQAEAVRPVAESIESMHRQTTLVREQLGACGAVLTPLVELYRLFPDRASLSALNVEESGVVTIKGMAESMSQVFELVPRLEASPVFESVTVNYVNQRNIGEGRLIDFQISMEAAKNAGVSQEAVQ